MVWRFQFSHRAVLRMSDAGGWAWHAVTRNARDEIEPLIREALALAAATQGWLEALRADAAPAAALPR